jgi:hypothetical protein
VGELLVAAGVIGAAQLEEGLRAQVLYGARLGTNLVELGHVELDHVAFALAKQHNYPPALRRHFERCNPEVQRLLPSAAAARRLVVPIGYLAGDRSKVLLAARDPVPAPDLAELEREMGLPRGGLVVSVAAELRILFFLERVYGVPRSNRFLRVRRSSTADTTGEHTYHPFEDGTGRFQAVAPQTAEEAAEEERDDEDETQWEPAIHDEATTAGGRPNRTPPPDALAHAVGLDLGQTAFDPPEDFHIEETPVEHLLDPTAPANAWRRPRAASQADDTPPPPEVVPAPVEQPLTVGGEEVRRFVETIADPALPAAALGRIAIRQRRKTRRPVLSATGSGSGEVAEAAAIATILVDGAGIEDVARAIRRGHSRARVGELAIGALRKFGKGLDAGLLFVVREDTAIGWKGFSYGVDDLAIDELAVPLDAPTVLAAAVREGRALLIDGDHGSEIDKRLWRALDKPTPGQVAVAPVILAGHTVCLFYGQSAPGTLMAPHAELFAGVQQATTSAFARLLRAAQR